MTTLTTSGFANRHALIFGAAKGIGAAVALEFARRGAHVTVADVDVAGAQHVAETIMSQGGKAQALACDVLDDTAFTQCADEAERTFGQADIVMNNVGAMIHGAPEDIPMSEWHRLMEINLFSVMRGVTRFLGPMQERGHGHIVNTASFAGFIPYATSRLPYAAAKAAIISLTQNLAIHAEPQGVRISCFIPGPVMTGIQGSIKSWSEAMPMRGPGSQYAVLTTAEVATILADGMERGDILILTHDEVWDALRDWAQSPDAYLRSKMDSFARGEAGLPTAETMAAAIARAEPPKES